MTTTSCFQVEPDYYSSLEDTQRSRKKHNTNPRYKFFNQTHFTAGDVEQFQMYRDANGLIANREIDMSSNITRTNNLPESVYWDKYKHIGPQTIDHTFQYLFNKFKKGIFIKIKDGELKVFLPFSKKNFTNEWAGYIQVHPKYKTIENFIQYIQAKEGRKCYPNSINRYIDSWYSNNALVRWEYPIQENDTNNTCISDMFHTLCRDRKLPDMELFINRRDFPLLKKDGTEPYNHIFGENTKLLSHSYDKYCPILSMVGSRNYADIPIPTGDDWSRIARGENKYFTSTARRSYSITDVNWENKKPIAVFRGSSTGSGVTIDTNPRLKVAFLSHNGPVDQLDQLPLLDAGITEWNLRPRKIQDHKYLETIDVDRLPFPLVDPLTPAEQCKYKYIINIDGHVSAYRLSLELEMGSCILLVESKYKLWFSHLLEPYIHYVPIKSDLSDLFDKIKWCKRNDTQCQQIATNAKHFASLYLSKNGILDYLQHLLVRLQYQTGNYMYNYPFAKVQLTMESNLLRIWGSNMVDVSQLHKVEHSIPTRSYAKLKAMEWIVQSSQQTPIWKESIQQGQIIFENHMTEIRKFSYLGMDLIQKQSKNQLIHEGFIGLSSLNPLSEIIPNFAFTFGRTDPNCMIGEYIRGMTLKDYIHSDKFSMPSYIFILIQLGLALHVAQKYCNFVHYDLTPWNIILQELENPQIVEYPIDGQKVYRVKTNLVPIIIDYGRSHVVYNHIHYGVVNLFNMNTIQDVLTVLNTSISEVTMIQTLTSGDIRDLVCLSNFLANTTYRPKPFHITGKDGLGDIRYFFGKAKKYSELLLGNKYELRDRTPIDFVSYIETHFQIRRKDCSLQVTNSLQNINSMTPLYYFKTMVEPSNSSKIQLIWQMLSGFPSVSIDSGIPYHCQLYMIQKFEKDINALKSILDNELHTHLTTRQKKYSDILYQKAIDSLSSKYWKLIHKKHDISYTYHPIDQILDDATIFTTPQKVFNILDKNRTMSKVNYTHDSFILEWILLNNKTMYPVPNQLRTAYLRLCRDVKWTQNKERWIDYNTLRVISYGIYSRDVETVSHATEHDPLFTQWKEEQLQVYRSVLGLVENKNETENAN